MSDNILLGSGPLAYAYSLPIVDTPAQTAVDLWELVAEWLPLR